MTVDSQDILDFFEQVCRIPDNPVASFWDRYWLKTGHIRRLLIMVEYLAPLLAANPSMLDIGSFGEIPLIAWKFFKLNSASAVSQEGNYVGYAHGRLVQDGDPGLEYGFVIGKCDVEKEPLKYPDAHFDLVTCFEVIEHLRHDPMFMLLEIHRVLRGDGTLVLSTPNASCWDSLARVAGLESPFMFSSYMADLSGIGHTKEYSVNELRQLLENAGFTIDKLSTFDSGPSQFKPTDEFADLHDFAKTRPWWKGSLRDQTIIVHAKKNGMPRTRIYMPLYTAEFSFGKYPGDQPTSTAGSVGEPGGSATVQDQEGLNARSKHTEELQSELEKCREWTVAIQKESEARHRYSLELQSELERCRKWAHSADEEIKRERAFNTKLQAEFDERGLWAQSLNEEIENLRAEFDKRGLWGQSLDEEIKDLSCLLDEKQKEIARLESHLRSGRFLAKQLWKRFWRSRS